MGVRAATDQEHGVGPDTFQPPVPDAVDATSLSGFSGDKARAGEEREHINILETPNGYTLILVQP